MNTIDMTENKAFDNIIRKKADSLNPAVQFLKAEGNYIAPPQKFITGFDKALEKENLFRQYATVINLESSEGIVRGIESTGDAEIVEMNGAFPESNDTITTYDINIFKLAALIKLKDNFVNDDKFDIENYLERIFARRFGRAEERLFINGNGVDEPMGILTADATITTEGDDIAYADIVNLYFSLKDEYAKNAVFIVNRRTAMTLRLITDTNGQPIWNMSDNTIFSRPVLISEFMPDAESGNKAIAFGDLSFYLIMIRQPLRIKVLEQLFARQYATGYAASERLDAKLIRSDAVSILQMK
ncbi:MAG: phage major capsid protein [Clostridia bacterium]|nr:phage major capsid protein [Clostridia bacterium]